MCSALDPSQLDHSAPGLDTSYQHKRRAQLLSPSPPPKKKKENGTHISCGQEAVARRQPQKPVLLVCIAPAPRTMPGRDLTESLCRLRVLPVATRAAQLSPLNLNCSAPDSAAERTFSSPERALDSKARGRKLRPLPARVPPLAPQKAQQGWFLFRAHPARAPARTSPPGGPPRTAVALTPALGPPPSPGPPD